MLVKNEMDALHEEKSQFLQKAELLREEGRIQERERLQREFDITREKDRVEIVQNMLKNKMDVESIHKCINISVNEILMIKNELDS